MKNSSIETLSKIREEIWKIQSLAEKENQTESSFSDIHKQLGLLSNQIMRYIHTDLENSASQDELLNKLEILVQETQDPLPYFTDLNNNLEIIINNRTLIQEDTDYMNKVKETAQELINKVS